MSTKPRFEGGFSEQLLDRTYAKTAKGTEKVNPSAEDDVRAARSERNVASMTGFTCLGEDRAAEVELANRRAAGQRRQELRRQLAKKGRARNKRIR